MAANSLQNVYQNNRDKGAKLQKTFMIPIDCIVVEHEENVRLELDMEHAMRFAHSFLEGKEVPPVYVKMIDGLPHLIEGYHRVTGFIEAQKQGLEDDCIECKEFKGDDVDRLMFMMDSSDGKPLSFIEKAEAYNKLNSEFGVNATDIAKRMGVSHTDVNNKLCLAQADENIKKEVIAGTISATMAIEYITKYGDDAYERILYDLSKAQSKGKTKVTAASSGGTGAFSAAKARTALEILSGTLNYEHIAPKLGTLQGIVDVDISIEADDLKDLIEIIEEYVGDE